MRIAYIGRFNRTWDEEGIARVFEALGHTVIRMPEERFEPEEYREAISGGKVDFVLWAKLRVPERNTVPAITRKAGVPSVCWVFDLYWGLSREWQARRKEAMFKADYVFTTDGGHDEEWAKAGVNHNLLRQGILPMYSYRAGHVPGANTPHVAFVGGLNPDYPYRTQVIRKVQEWYGKHFAWYGELDGDEVRGHKLNLLYATIPALLGDSVYTPQYWSNRVYETIGRGGLLIHPAVPGLDAEFTPYRHYIPYQYGDWAGLREILDYYGADWQRGEAIRQAGFDHCRAHHTYTHRCQALIDHISRH